MTLLLAAFGLVISSVSVFLLYKYRNEKSVTKLFQTALAAGVTVLFSALLIIITQR